MRGLAARSDGGFAAIYSTTEVGRDNVPGPLRFWLEILAADGTSRGRLELRDVGFVGGLSVAKNGDLLLSVSEEYPQVRRLRVALP